MTTKALRYIDSKENRAILFEFYRQVYPDSSWLLDHDRFSWQSFQNPLLSGGVNEIWLLCDETGQIIGQNIYILYELSIGGELQRGYCSTNLIVKPGLVGKGLGHKLIDINENRGGVAYAVGITPASTRAFLKRGWVPVNDARLYSRFVKPAPNLRYVKASPLKRLVASPLLYLSNLLMDFVTFFAVPHSIKGVTSREINHFETSWDQYWNTYLRSYAIHFNRASTQLNYKYFTRTDVDHSVLLFEKDSKPVGYLVYRLSENKERGLRLGRIVDLVYDPSLGPKMVRYMIRIAVKKLQKLGIDGLVGAASNSVIGRAYMVNGLYLSRVQPAIIKENEFSVTTLRNHYKNLWYITLGDSDLDNYW